ncbi:phosphatase PAP2 family protein [Cellulophaga lytica]|uniref:Phosphoesterase PA-phosphatase related protein n=1 Tax=Cellulophaga lytica (strain ATCC 23178 / DSM 7489 / JCM 8516 / NBRC 14961 / NCIMB 1423 / VKM B-1433 / Cy l20) TaxID=867900 RepID=F0RBM5_CELLC|nr:phosphatase PAP2 family protein [Cellulophaga lytica]ADY30675.1 phosphoesterase PA-phosphatase related protein [Cellulophaga lytica DSM 7489]WQG78399.1 phosphatase PAP2 family protein [Cellulophaga lytica]
MKIKIAQFISVLGHPLLLFPFLILIFNLNDKETVFSHTLSLIYGIFFLVLIAWVYIGKRRGKYTDLDVSNKRERRSLYIFALPLMVLVLFFLFYTKQPVYICTSFSIATLMLLASFGINFLIKISMHVAINIYLALAIIFVNRRLGVVLILFTFLVMWSRLVLKRHTPKEVVTGLIIGSLFGLTLVLIS